MALNPSDLKNPAQEHSLSDTHPATPKFQVLAVDDEASILLGLRQELLTAGYVVSTAESGEAALSQLEQNPPDLVLLDLMLPDCSGLEVIRYTREVLHSDVPIIVLSARGEERQKVEALDLGANDYLTKPFGIEELLARVRASLRLRSQVSPPAYAGSPPSSAGDASQIAASNGASHSSQIIGNHQLSIDASRHLVLREGAEVRLTPKQFDLLVYLAHNPDRLLSHRVLLHNVWGGDHENQTEYLHVFIGQLRQKIEPNPAKPRFIITEPGLGYRFKLPV